MLSSTVSEHTFFASTHTLSKNSRVSGHDEHLDKFYKNHFISKNSYCTDYFVSCFFSKYSVF